MSLQQFPTVDLRTTPSSAADHARVSSKRKLDDYAYDDDYDADYSSDLITVRMRKDDSLLAVNSSSNAVGDESSSPLSSNQPLDTRAAVTKSSVNQCSSSSSSSSAAGPTRSPSRLQFFVRMISDGNHIVVYANSNDTVKSLHERIQMITGIPVMEQRLIYRGKQLQWEQLLSECSIQKDTALHLVGRMRSTRHPQTCQLIDDMVSLICRLCKTGLPCHPYAPKHIKQLMNEFFSLTPKDDNDVAIEHLQVFSSSAAPTALVMLYVSTIKGNKECADSSIRHFLNSCKHSLPKHLHTQCAPIILEFCKLLRKVAVEDPLYISCRSTLGSLVENLGALPWLLKYGIDGEEDVKGLIAVEEIFPFVSELANRLSKDLVSSMESPTSVGPLLSDVRDFAAFLLPLHCAIFEQVGFGGPISMPLDKSGFSRPLFAKEIEQLHFIFKDLLKKMGKCLTKMEESLKPNGEVEPTRIGWSQYLAILKELNSISKLYKDDEEEFWTVLRRSKVSLCLLIVRYAKRTDDHQWLLQHKDVSDFESRRHLAMMMFPEVKEDYEELHEMLIDRSQLLTESFEYIGRADPDALHGGLFMEFKNEEATGPGVLREWFFLVAQAIFNPQNALFVACPNDRRRFYPNPASKANPMHLDYFTFSGRVIALALMHKVQVGVVFDRVFFLQLAGMPISLQDIRDADPCLYSSCKQILDMDAEFIDSDALGLAFVCEIEELGCRKVVELCPGGKSIVVNSKNREEYVNLLVQYRFVTSISEQISRFAQGFSDILSNSRLQKFFFGSLELEDLDWMLYGSEKALCIEDWMAHTDYNGYKETDPQISWFWKIIGGMSPEQRKILLFFWTSVKYLPIEGFRGLASRLYIYRSSEPHDRLPSSHTCFYRLCFPPYPSFAVMQDRLRVITQEHVGCSFGTW